MTDTAWICSQCAAIAHERYELHVECRPWARKVLRDSITYIEETRTIEAQNVELPASRPVRPPSCAKSSTIRSAMDPFQALRTYFTSGAAETERDVLADVFVAPNQLAEILGAGAGSFRVVVGHKGVGKTALLEHLRESTRKRGVPALLLRPDLLDVGALAAATDIATIKRKMYESLIVAVAAHVGSTLEGLQVGAAAELYNSAVNVKRRKADWMGRVLAFLGNASKPLTQIEAKQLATDLAGAESSHTLVTALEGYFAKQDRALFVMLDDTDQIASPDDPIHLNRIWGLLLAMRQLANECSTSVRCIASLRAEVWNRLQRDEKGQRDQVDHIRPLIVDLRATPEMLTSILRRRVQLAAQLAGVTDKRKAFGTFFEGESVRLPTSEEQRSWPDFIVKSSRDRPRDMVQLVELLAKNAQQGKRSRITSTDAEEAMVRYSEERASDTATEFGRDCPQLGEILRTFGDLDDFKLKFEPLRKHLASVPSRFSVTIRGKTLAGDDDDAALALLGLLHEAGFINPRVRDARETRGFRHVNYRDDPNFVRKARWNDLQAVEWEIHPAFRDFIHNLRGNKRSSIA